MDPFFFPARSVGPSVLLFRRSHICCDAILVRVEADQIITALSIDRLVSGGEMKCLDEHEKGIIASRSLPGDQLRGLYHNRSSQACNAIECEERCIQRHRPSQPRERNWSRLRGAKPHCIRSLSRAYPIKLQLHPHTSSLSLYISSQQPTA